MKTEEFNTLFDIEAVIGEAINSINNIKVLSTDVVENLEDSTVKPTYEDQAFWLVSERDRNLAKTNMILDYAIQLSKKLEQLQEQIDSKLEAK